MAATRDPEILPPLSDQHPRGDRDSAPRRPSPQPTSTPGSSRVRGSTGWARDENLDLLSHLLDDFIRIPGTPIRFGLDGIVGLIPGVGDLLGGIASTLIILAAWSRGVPRATLLRMISNVGIEVVLGTIPVLGDAFDIAWRANRRNYALLVGSVAEPVHHERRSRWFLVALCAILLLLLVLPLVLFSWLTAHFLHGMLH